LPHYPRRPRLEVRTTSLGARQESDPFLRAAPSHLFLKQFATKVTAKAVILEQKCQRGSPPSPLSDGTRFSTRSGLVAWATFIAPGTHGWAASSPSRSSGEASWTHQDSVPASSAKPLPSQA